MIATAMSGDRSGRPTEPCQSAVAPSRDREIVCLRSLRLAPLRGADCAYGRARLRLATPAGSLVGQGVGDALLQRVGHRLCALAGDHDPQLRFEVEGLVARRAVVEVALDLRAALDRQLTIEVAVQLVQRVVAVSVSHQISDPWITRPSRAPPQTPTTSSGGLFFPGAACSSRYRSGS